MFCPVVIKESVFILQLINAEIFETLEKGALGVKTLSKKEKNEYNPYCLSFGQ